MLHPFSEDTKDLSISQMHDKVQDLTKKYFQTNNTEIKAQIQTFIEYYTQEIIVKEQEEKKQQQQIGDIDLDKLINIQ